MTRNKWESMHALALQSPGTKINFTANAVQNTFANKLGEHNLNGITDPTLATSAKDTNSIKPSSKINWRLRRLLRFPHTLFKSSGNDCN
jgi:hypothetical protein